MCGGSSMFDGPFNYRFQCFYEVLEFHYVFCCSMVYKSNFTVKVETLFEWMKITSHPPPPPHAGSNAYAWHPNLKKTPNDP